MKRAILSNRLFIPPSDFHLTPNLIAIPLLKRLDLMSQVCARLKSTAPKTESPLRGTFDNA